MAVKSKIRGDLWIYIYGYLWIYMIYMIYVDIKMFEKLVNNWLAYKMKKCGLWISSMV